MCLLISSAFENQAHRRHINIQKLPIILFIYTYWIRVGLYVKKIGCTYPKTVTICRVSALDPSVSRNRREVAAELLPAHDRCMKHPSCESQIKENWKARLTADPSLYNGAKFRLAGMCREGRKER